MDYSESRLDVLEIEGSDDESGSAAVICTIRINIWQRGGTFLLVSWARCLLNYGLAVVRRIWNKFVLFVYAVILCMCMLAG
ncbi:hypothetical protein DSUL_50219 [Desulfovibrionales bacterium]